jgi:tetratricopeptide (TPR) repeat protein
MNKYQKSIKQIEAKFQAGKYAEALDLCHYAITLDPRQMVAYQAKARLLQIQRNFAESERYYTAAEKRGKLSADDFINRGIVKSEQQKYDEAVGDFTKALALKPEYLHAIIQRGAAHWEMHRWSEALRDFRRANELSPEDPNANWILGLLLLQQNEFEEGWPLYETRWRSDRFKSRRLVTDKKQWSLKSEAKSVLLWGEQGLGDQIIYGSLIPAIRERTEKVTAMVDPRLIKLFKTSMPSVDFIANTEQVRSDLHEEQIPFASVGWSFVQAKEDIPKYVARNYLKADPELVKKYRAELGLDPKKLTIGVSWISAALKIGPHKSVTLEELLPILKLDANFVNLQYGSEKKAVDQFNATHQTQILTSSVNMYMDMDGLAALCEICDVIVAISSSTVHLAGAMGRPVLLMDANKLWYWGNKDGDRSLWYPSVQIFPRDNMISPWGNVIELVKLELEGRLK